MKLHYIKMRVLIGVRYTRWHSVWSPNVSGHSRAWVQLLCLSTNVSGHKCVWAQTCLGTVMYMGLIVWAQSCLGTNVFGHKRDWTQTSLGTIMSGHNHVWAESCLGTNVQGTNVLGHKLVRAQMCLGTNVSGYKRVWAQTYLGTNVCWYSHVVTVVWAYSCMSTNLEDPFFHVFRDTVYYVRKKKQENSVFWAFLTMFRNKCEKTVFFSRFSWHFVMSSHKMQENNIFSALCVTFRKMCEKTVFFQVSRDNL